MKKIELLNKISDVYNFAHGEITDIVMEQSNDLGDIDGNIRSLIDGLRKALDLIDGLQDVEFDEEFED